MPPLTGLTPIELLDLLSQVMIPPRLHKHRLGTAVHAPRRRFDVSAFARSTTATRP